MSPLPATRPLFLCVLFFFFCKPHALGLRRNGLLLGGSKILVPPPLCRPFGIGGLPRQLGNAGTKAGARSLLIAGESSRVCSQKVLAFGLCSLVGAIWALGGVERGGLLVRAPGLRYTRRWETVQGPDVIWKDTASPNQSLLLKMKR